MISNIEELKKSLFDGLNLVGISDEEKEKIFEALSNNLESQMHVYILNQLSDEDAEEYTALCEGGDLSGIENFLNDRDIDLARLGDVVGKYIIDDFRQLRSI
jgi:hypothetical protein